MITNLQIRNFMSHKNSRLKFVPGVNVIIGQSRAGKSAIIKALNLLINNRPSGDSFRSYWGSTTKISIDTWEENKIQRLKSDSINQYKINDNESYESFGTNVPEKIKNVLNIGEVNIGTQFDSHYLLNKTSGEIAAHFNKIAHLDQIDYGQKNIKSWMREIQKEKSIQQNNLQEKTEQLKQYDNLGEIENRIIELETLQQTRIDTEDNKDKLQNIVEEIEEIDSEIQSNSHIIELDSKLDEVIEIINHRQEVENNTNQLKELVNEIEEISDNIIEIQSFLELETQINNVISSLNERTKIESEIKELQKLTNEINNVENQITNNESKLNKLEEEFHDKFPEQCPLCETYKNTLE